MFDADAPIEAPRQLSASPPPRPLSAARRLELTQRVHEATVNAREMRVKAMSGGATRRDLERAELDRQAAIRALDQRQEGPLRGEDLPRPAWRGLEISGVTFTRVIENGRPVLLVTGAVRNTAGRTMDLPPVTLVAIDAQGFVLGGQTAALEQASVGVGGPHSFTARFKNPPQYTSQLRAHFYQRNLPFLRQDLHGCEQLSAPSPQVRADPDYSPDELAALWRLAQREAADAYRNAFGLLGAPPPAPPASAAGPNLVTPACPAGDLPAPPPWRPLMILADLIEEAHAATLAADIARRDGERGVFTPAEVQQAELARQRAVRAFMEASPQLRPTNLPSMPGLVIENLSKGEGRDDQFVVGGDVVNTGSTPLPRQILKVSLLDRHGVRIVEQFKHPSGQIGAGERQSFSIGVPVPPGMVGEIRVEFSCPEWRRGQILML